jgi:HEAT repeat protein
MLEKIGWQPGRDESGALYWILKDEWAKCTEIGALAVGLLLSALNDSNWDVRQNAAKALGTIGDARAIEPLITGLKDRDKNVQWAATEALGKMGSPAVHSLIAALKDSYSRKFAVIALGEIGDARAVEPLIAMLNDNDCDLRIKIVRALGVIGNPHAVGPLIAALKDSELDVRRCAAEALEKIGWQPGQDESGTYYWMGKNNWEKCVEIGAPAVEPLTVALKDNDGSVRQRAAKALGEVNDARAVEPLITALKDRDKFVRQTAAEALGEIGDPRAIERLIVVLNDHTGTVRHAAATALVVMYQRLKLDDQTIQQILAQRTKIVISHEDRAYCNLHTDEGIGVEFPL